MRFALCLDWIRLRFRINTLVLDEIQWKYDGNKPSEKQEIRLIRSGTSFVNSKKTRLKYPRNTRRGGSLSEIVNSYLNYFTELARFISTLFQPYFACLPQAGNSYLVQFRTSSSPPTRNSFLPVGSRSSPSPTPVQILPVQNS